MSRAQLDPTAARSFILAGRARVTLESAKTGARYTFRVSAAPDGGAHFVSVLTGSDNESDYTYLGTIRGAAYNHGRKSSVSADAPSARVIAWAWPRIAAGHIPADLNVWHEGRCGRCALPLTDPVSIAAGFGPTCRGK